MSLYALVSLVVPRSRGAAIVALAAAAIALALRSHPAATHLWWGMGAIALHVAVAVFWAGLLAHLVFVLWRGGAALPAEVMRAALRRYARLALWSVLVVLASGLVAALAVFGSVGQIVTTGYGRVLLVKTALVALALGLALLSRLRGVRRAPATFLPLVRTLTRVEVLAVGAVLGAAVLLGNVAPPFAPPNAASALLGAPAPAGPASYVAGQAGWLEVYLSASAGRLTLRVYAPGGATAQGAQISAVVKPPAARSAAIASQACGPGCFTTPITWRRGITSVRLGVVAPGWPGGALTLPVSWPPLPRAPRLLARMIAALRAQRVVAMGEYISSGPHATAHDRYRFSGARFLATEPYSGGHVSEVYGRPSGAGLSQLVVYLPGTPFWARLWIDSRDRPRREEIVVPSYWIQRTFSYPPAVNHAPGRR